MPASDREIQVTFPGRRTFALRATYQDREPFGWIARTFLEDDQEGEATAMEFSSYVASDPFDCLGEAVRTLTRAAELREDEDEDEDESSAES